MKWKTALLVLIIGLQCAWVLSTAVVQERALAEGTPILLETAPVDPRDLLRGDYVILNYKISTLTESLFQTGSVKSVGEGQTVYVALEPEGEFYRAVAASTEKLRPHDSQVVLKGRVQRNFSTLANGGSGFRLQVAYGLEKFYVREGTGNPRGKLTVQVAVPPSGNARIKQVFIDGRPYAEVMKAVSR